MRSFQIDKSGQTGKHLIWIMSKEVPQWNYGLRINEYINNSAMLIFKFKISDN